MKTKRNIGIGATLSEVKQAYSKALEGKTLYNNWLIAGTDYGGLMFEFGLDNKVKSIFLGAKVE